MTKCNRLLILAIVGVVVLVSCSPEPKLPEIRCTDSGTIAIFNPNSSPLTDLRVTVTSGEEFIAENLPPVGENKTIEVLSFRRSNYQPTTGRFNCSAVTQIQASFKINGEQRSMTAK